MARGSSRARLGSMTWLEVQILEALIGRKDRRGMKSIIHAPQHFLYFLPLPHVHGSFLPILGLVFFI
jgi:hypothetical protein